MLKGKEGIKKGVLFLIIVIMIFSLFYFHVSIEENDIPEDVIQYLLSIGTEQEFLDMISNERIQQLYLRLVDSDYEVNFVDYQFEAIETDSEPSGRNPINSLQITVGVFEFISNGRIQAVQISISYRWNAPPISMPGFGTDAHTFTFDPNLFMIGEIFAESGFTRSELWHSIDYVDVPAFAADGGLGWFLKRQVTDGVTNQPGGNFVGGADILLIPRNVNATRESLNSQMFYTYAQQRAGTRITLGVNESPIWIIGGSFNYQTKIINY